MLHNWTGYIALAATLVHPVLLLPSATARFGWLDLVLPFWAPSQPIINTIGVFAAYALIFVVVTSYLRKRIGLGTWKKLHYVAYAVTIALFAHSILTSPNLDDPIDFTDGGKVFIEACTMIALAAITWRILYGAASPKAHRHDGLVQVAGQGRRRSPRASSWPDDGERRQVFACCSLGGSSSGL